MEKYTKSRTSTYNCNYHIVFTTKYRKKVLTKGVEDNLKNFAQEIAKDKEFEIIEIEIGEEDHVHVFVSAHPKISASYIAKMLKGILGRKLLISNPEIKTKLHNNHLWSGSYFVETIGSTNEEAIKKYIENQKANSSRH